MTNILDHNDPDVAASLKNEIARQQGSLELIPSENFVSLAVLEALGSVFTNKYSEGYPGKRYYGGNQFIDEVETLAIARAQGLFGAAHVNVQPLSGAPANLAAYTAVLKPGDTALGMDLSHGGHLTHGHPVTFPAKVWKFVRYETTPEGTIDMDAVRALALHHKPKLILCGYSAYSRDLDYAAFKAIADEVGAVAMADIAHIAGLIAAKEMNDPVPHMDIITTTTHKTLRGPRGGMILCTDEYAKAIDKAVFPGLQGGPHENVIAAKAVAFGEALRPEFRDYARQIKVNAKAIEEVFVESGIPVMFGRTDNHLLLIDVSPTGLTGGQAQELLDTVGITLNKNMIPNDPRKPTDPSGIRLGTPALTTRGFTEEDFREVGRLIVALLRNPDNDAMANKVRTTVRNLTDAHPLYPELTA